jgi:hypothetical protein
MAKDQTFDREFFRKHGSQGGTKAKQNQSPKERKERARNAAKARWAKRKEKS